MVAIDFQDETSTHASVAEVWSWLADVPDPEIPAVSVVDLGIIRDVAWHEDTCIVTVTPTYSGCPATEVIGTMIREALAAHSLTHVDLRVQLSPAWTTDWIGDAAKEKLRVYGIAPPTSTANAPGAALGLAVLGQDSFAATKPACPRCASTHTEIVSRFGSTPCKALHRCLACLEPFDAFKCH